MSGTPVKCEIERHVVEDCLGALVDCDETLRILGTRRWQTVRTRDDAEDMIDISMARARITEVRVALAKVANGGG